MSSFTSAISSSNALAILNNVLLSIVYLSVYILYYPTIRMVSSCLLLVACRLLLAT
jgi:hypothetical protein